MGLDLSLDVVLTVCVCLCVCVCVCVCVCWLVTQWPIRHGIVEDWDLMERFLEQAIFKYLRAEPEDHYFLLVWWCCLFFLLCLLDICSFSLALYFYDVSFITKANLGSVAACTHSINQSIAGIFIAPLQNMDGGA